MTKIKKEKNNVSNDLILTGIPRSGTSYLCSLLHNIKNCVAINEPDRMSGRLRKKRLPEAASIFHHETRQAILQQQPIQNKLTDGSLIEDTALLEQYENYLPQVTRDDFLLCSKNTLGYLARLEGFQRVMPDAPIITCIRNPIDTIASWKQSFPHLETASAATQHIIGALNDNYISDWQRKHLIPISEETRIEDKRAMFWAYLAKWIRKNKSKSIIVRYEDLVTKPVDTLFSIFQQSQSNFPFILQKEATASTVRTKKRNSLSLEDKKAIEEICFPISEKFGYQSDFTATVSVNID